MRCSSRGSSSQAAQYLCTSWWTWQWHHWPVAQPCRTLYLLSILHLHSLLYCVIHHMHIETLIDWIDRQVSTMATNVAIYFKSVNIHKNWHHKKTTSLQSITHMQLLYGSRELWLTLTLTLGKKDCEAPGNLYFVGCICCSWYCSTVLLIVDFTEHLSYVCSVDFHNQVNTFYFLKNSLAF